MVENKTLFGTMILLTLVIVSLLRGRSCAGFDDRIDGYLSSSPQEIGGGGGCVGSEVSVHRNSESVHVKGPVIGAKVNEMTSDRRK
jgi:hypothetical protein